MCRRRCRCRCCSGDSRLVVPLSHTFVADGGGGSEVSLLPARQLLRLLWVLTHISVQQGASGPSIQLLRSAHSLSLSLSLLGGASPSPLGGHLLQREGGLRILELSGVGPVGTLARPATSATITALYAAPLASSTRWCATAPAGALGQARTCARVPLNAIVIAQCCMCIATLAEVKGTAWFVCVSRLGHSGPEGV